jgi:hypothetical protein
MRATPWRSRRPEHSPSAPPPRPAGGDRHHLTLTTLMRLANEAGLHFRRCAGVPLAHYALLTPCPPGP